jgi:WhiB family redox-sensing transcriptional regulator
MGGGTANAAIKALSAPEYVQPTPELCGQCSPKYGVWAGVKLPGGQYRKREQLARAHDVLRRIAAGEVNARQLPENAALLARCEGDAVPVTAVVLHLPAARVGPRSAA